MNALWSAFKEGLPGKQFETCRLHLSFMLASAEGQRPAAGAFESTAGEGGPAGLRVWS